MWRCRQQGLPKNNYTSCSVSECGKKPRTCSSVDVTYSNKTTASCYSRPPTFTSTNPSPLHLNVKHNDTNHHEPLNHKETIQLRALAGSPQWPSTQSAPHLQCAVSQLAGKVGKGIVSSLELGNKVLRMAQANANVGPHYHALGDHLPGFSDATYASRDDLSSQGGYLLCMAHRDVIDGNEGFYNVLDWRSWKLASVAS